MDCAGSDRRHRGLGSHVLAEITELIDDQHDCTYASADGFRASFATACVDCTGNTGNTSNATSSERTR